AARGNRRPRREAHPAPMTEATARAALRIAISIPCRDWLRRVPDARARCRRLVRAALADGGFDPRRIAGAGSVELSLMLGDDALLRKLNRDFRNQDKPTNVLSFPGLDLAAGAVEFAGQASGGAPPVSLGDVAIAYETTAYEA